MIARPTTARPRPDAPTDAEIAATYWHATQAALHGPVLADNGRTTDAFARALDVLHTLSLTEMFHGFHVKHANVSRAAGRALDLGRERLREALGRPCQSPPDIRPGRGVWVLRLDAQERLVTIPATVLDIDAASGRALLAPEADEKRVFWALILLLEPRVAGVSHLPVRSASARTASSATLSEAHS